MKAIILALSAFIGCNTEKSYTVSELHELAQKGVDVKFESTDQLKEYVRHYVRNSDGDQFRMKDGRIATVIITFNSLHEAE